MGKKGKKLLWRIPLIIVTFGLLLLVVLIIGVPFDLSCGIMGFIASVTGIIVTVLQVSSAIDKTEAVTMEVMKNSNEIRAHQNIASYSKKSEIVRTIIDALPSNEYKFISWRIGELKDFLVNQKKNTIVAQNSKWCATIDGLVLDLGMDIQNLVKKSHSRSFVLDIELIAKHLTCVSTLLAEVSGVLENEKYEQTKSN